MFFSRKKDSYYDDETKEKEMFKKATANDFVNIDSLDDGVLYTKDKKLFMYIKIEPLSLELLSEKEKSNKIKLFASEFSSEKGAYKLFSMSRSVDISGLIENLNEQRRACLENDFKRKELLREEISYVNKLALKGDIIQREFYMAIWCDNRGKYSKKELLERALDIVKRFEKCVVFSAICNDTDISNMFNQFSNPRYAHMESSDYEDYIPRLN